MSCVPVRLPRAAYLARGRIAQRADLERGDGAPAPVSRRRRPAALLPRGDALAGSDVLTAYVLAIAHEAGYSIPDDARAQMVEGLRGFVAGRLHRDSRAGRRPTSRSASLPRSMRLSRYGAAEPSMLDQHRARAGSLADLGGARLARRCWSGSPMCRAARRAWTKRGRSCARGSTSRARRWAFRPSATMRSGGSWSPAMSTPRVPCWFVLDGTGLAGRPAAHDARPARASAARTLGHDDRQRLGRARDEQVQRARSRRRRSPVARSPSSA